MQRDSFNKAKESISLGFELKNQDNLRSFVGEVFIEMVSTDGTLLHKEHKKNT